MKKWSDIPEFRNLIQEIGEERIKLEAEQEAKGIRLEFDPVLEEAHRKNVKKLDLFCENYIKDHPEEFDENGDFIE